MNRLIDLDRDLGVEGSISIEGEDIFGPGTDLPTLRQKMGLLGQRPNLLPMSIYKNVAYGLRLKGVRDKDLIDYSVEKNLREVGLWKEVRDRLHASPQSLSIGQQQRLCLARGLAVKPRIILADEPTSALDPISSKIIEDLFLELKRHYTIILVTHVLRQAKRLADNVVFMYYGEIVEQGESAMLLHAPRTEKLRNYIFEGH
ncbi:MAG: ATP-binding cassette domain-containing protein [Bacteroidales bacterium]